MANDMWLSKQNISSKAYYHCRHIRDSKKMRKHIFTSQYAFCYCRYIKDDEKVRKQITSSYFAYRYCYEIKHDPILKKYVTDKRFLESLKELERKRKCG